MSPKMPDLDSESSAIWHMLTDNELADDEQLVELWEEHERTGLTFQQTIYNYGVVGEAQLLKLIAETLGSEYVDIKGIHISDEVIQSVKGHIARMYGVLPVAEDGGVITIAAVEPMNFRMIDELPYVLGRDRVEVVVAKPEAILEAIDHFYPESMGDSMHDVLAEMQGFGEDAGETDENAREDITAAELEERANMTPIVRFVNIILYQAVKDQASDIHFEPFASEFKIRYRIDGVLYEMQPPPKHLAIPVISRVKVVSGLNIAERRLPQDGRIEMRVAGKKIDMRVSTLPTQHGESVVLRVLDKSIVNLSLDAIGLPDAIKTDLREIIRKPNGIVLVTGPTGSGKTTTLYSCLKELNTIEDKLLTAEDPVEYDIEGLIQVPINDGIGMTFARALKAFLRQDPDRIMIGEIRDLETASMSVQASLTGHLVLSTLHTNDAPGAVTRLIDMGVEPFLITSTIEGVLAQRLVRRVCKYCREQYEPTDEELEALDISRADIGDRRFWYGRGCGECNDTGYKGRTGLFELFLASVPIKMLINRKEPAAVLFAKAREEGMRTLREHGIHAILEGDTTAEEILKYT